MGSHAASNTELAAPLFGGMISSALVAFSEPNSNQSWFYRMYGALICQTAWYLKTFPKDPTYLKVLVSTYPSWTAISSDFLIDCAIMHRKNAVNFVECQAKRSQFSQKLLVLCLIPDLCGTISSSGGLALTLRL